MQLFSIDFSLSRAELMFAQMVCSLIQNISSLLIIGRYSAIAFTPSMTKSIIWMSSQNVQRCQFLVDDSSYNWNFKA